MRHPGRLGEHAWLARLTARLAREARRAGAGGVLVGPGDDAAVVRGAGRPLLLTTDSLVEGVHFRRDGLAPRRLGRRAFAAAVSDVAAMGGVPRFGLLSIEAPRRVSTAELDAMVAGFAGLARRVGARLVGGNLTRGPHLALTATVMGEATGRVVTRGGARPGDGLYVTGALGAAGLAVARRGILPEPPLRLAAGRWLATVAHAMIDVSDGLLQDLGHVCRASGVAAEIELARVPVARACRRTLGARASRLAVTAGEDYELLAAIPPARVRTLTARSLGCALTYVGRVTPGPPRVRVLDERGRAVRTPHTGFDHFR